MQEPATAARFKRRLGSVGSDPEKQDNNDNHDCTLEDPLSSPLSDNRRLKRLCGSLKQKEEVTDIIHRLRNFSPSKIKQNLTATYQANNESLKLTITSLEKERDDFIQTEEQYKARIRTLQFENITAKRQKDLLVAQSEELARFFRFLERCRKRLKKVLQVMDGSTGG